MKQLTIDGNEACAYTSYLFTEVAGIYPITPSSPMAEHIDEWSQCNRKNIFNDKVKIVEMQSEAGAAGFVHGALQSGVLASTYTASQGLLLMIPNMYKIAGEMLPGVIHVAARSLSTHALSILGDHQDIYACRQTGFCMLASSSVQDCANLSGVAHLSSIKSSLPFLHFFDGFRTSHEINKVKVLDESDYEDIIDYQAIENFRNRSLKIGNATTVGTNQNDDIYFQVTEARNSNYDQTADIVNDYMVKINKKAGTNYKPFNYYGSLTAKKVIVAMGSVCETIKEVIETRQDSIGLIEVHLYRPFSIKYLKEVLPKTVERIAVLDRTKEAGSVGEPLYLDICAALNDLEVNIVGGRYGLSSKNTTPGQINAVYNMLDNPTNKFTIGINDDVTNLSLQEVPIDIKKSDEILIYGYGSDGMVSASKSIIKMIGQNTNKYVQGYFQYDSKKSGGVTISHLRIGDDIIRSTYYVESPRILVISKDSYLNEIHIIDDMEENGICIINTNKNEEELNKIISPTLANLFNEKHIKVYLLNAYKIASEVGLQNKISMIMEDAIFYLTNLMDYDKAKEELIGYIKTKFSKKGIDIVNANIKALNKTEQEISEVTVKPKKEKEENYDVFESINKRQGNNLPVSAFLNIKDGKMTACNITNSTNENVPRWLNDNCITCNQCSLVCPHGVIRPFLLDDEEYHNAPDYVQKMCIKDIPTGYYFILGIASENCTGCGLCIKTCPGKRKEKALVSESILKYNYQQIYDYLTKHIKDKNIDTKTVKGSQFKDSKFKFCGACAGCGEPAYIRLLTQICGDNLMIANATGCSSIYGGSIPNLPYDLPWASSLFEDNAEYGYGILLAVNTIRNRIKNVMLHNMDNPNRDLFKKWLDNYDDYKTTKEVYDLLTDDIPTELYELKEYIVSRSIWCIGGDGWAYDIGFSGIDHVLSSNDNINILVLDTELYSNTGGQASKASPPGSIESFATSGKRTSKKDLARIAMAYPNCYVAQVSLGGNPMQLIKALREANEFNGPSIVIAYAPCISHGIKGGMSNSLEMEKQAVMCGYFPLFRYHPVNGFSLDSKNVDFDKYEIFLNNQTRYSMLKSINQNDAQQLLKTNREDAFKRYKYYESLVQNK